jgi:hypothetical protein
MVVDRLPAVEYVQRGDAPAERFALPDDWHVGKPVPGDKLRSSVPRSPRGSYPHTCNARRSGRER